MMKKYLLLLSVAAACTFSAACGNSAAESSLQAQSAAAVSSESVSSEQTEESEETVDKKAESAAEEAKSVSEGSAESEAVSESSGEAAQAVLADGEYAAKFETDSSMFGVNEVYEDQGMLTVKDGQMTIHITLKSKNIVNLYPGLAEDAKTAEELLEPTEDEVTYSDGLTETVYGFDVPVPYLDEEFDLALIGTKGKWYDHKVMVTDVIEE